MKEKRGLFIYLTGSVMLAVSVFFPYLRLNFLKEESDIIEKYKESFNLMHLNELEEYYMGLGNVSTFTRVMIYLILAVGILGVLIVIFRLLAHDNYLSIVTFGVMAVSPLVGVIGNIAVRKDRFISAASDIIRDYKDAMLQQGFSGSSGYGVGYWLMLVGTVLTILGLILYFLDS